MHFVDCRSIIARLNYYNFIAYVYIRSQRSEMKQAYNSEVCLNWSLPYKCKLAEEEELLVRLAVVGNEYRISSTSSVLSLLLKL